jgi:urease accessory protein
MADGQDPVSDPVSASSPATLLRLMWLASPALPVGGFSYSEGLEAAVDAGLVIDEATAGDWLVDQLHLTLGRADLPACAQAMKAWSAPEPDGRRLQEIHTWVLATRETAEFRLQTEQMGRSLVTWMQHGEHGADARVAACAALIPAPGWPVAFALAAALTGATVREGLLAFAFGWAENMVQAAMKAVPLGQLAAQRMLQRLAQAIPAVVESAEALPEEDRQAFTPMLAILSARHEIQYSRLFRS